MRADPKNSSLQPTAIPRVNIRIGLHAKRVHMGSINQYQVPMAVHRAPAESTDGVVEIAHKGGREAVGHHLVQRVELVDFRLVAPLPVLIAPRANIRTQIEQRVVKTVARANIHLKKVIMPRANVKTAMPVSTEIKPRGRPRVNVKVVTLVGTDPVGPLSILALVLVPLVGTDPVGPLPILAAADVPRANIRWAAPRVVQTALRASTDPVGPVQLLALAIVTLVGTEVKRGKKQQTAMVLVPLANIRLLARPRVRRVQKACTVAARGVRHVSLVVPANTKTLPAPLIVSHVTLVNIHM